MPTLKMPEKIDMATGACSGFEALARWKRGEHWVSPSEFIPLAEQVGLSLNIFALGVRRSAQWLKKLEAAGRQGHYASVNLAACDLERDDLVPYVVNLLAHAELPPYALQIEITEQSIIRDFTTSERNLRALKNLGCRIAIDDFGTGYSSLSYIGKLPVDVLKLDRQFVADIVAGRPPGVAARVDLLLAMAEAGHGVRLTQAAVQGLIEGWNADRVLKVAGLQRDDTSLAMVRSLVETNIKLAAVQLRELKAARLGQKLRTRPRFQSPKTVHCTQAGGGVRLSMAGCTRSPTPRI